MLGIKKMTVVYTAVVAMLLTGCDWWEEESPPKEEANLPPMKQETVEVEEIAAGVDTLEFNFLDVIVAWKFTGIERISSQDSTQIETECRYRVKVKNVCAIDYRIFFLKVGFTDENDILIGEEALLLSDKSKSIKLEEDKSYGWDGSFYILKETVEMIKRCRVEVRHGR